MRRLPALVAALLLPASPPLLLGTAVSTATLLVSQSPAQAQSAEAVAKVAQAITVRIEGATQGSGVLVKRVGNQYTVLTAWHVVSGQRPGEELDIFVSDGTRQQLEQGSIKRLGEVDLAVLTFTSTNSYDVAQIGDIKSLISGSSIWVSGFPLPTSSVPSREWRFIKGDLIANAQVAIPDGYQLLYDNQTLPGVSGGAVLNALGQLVGIHGKAEKADQIHESSGKAVATGTNQGVPISFYKQYASGAPVNASSTQATSADDYLAQANSILSSPLPILSSESRADFLRIIGLAEIAIRLNPDNPEGFALRAKGRAGIGQNREAIEDSSKAIALHPKNWNALFARAVAKSELGDKQGALSDYSQAIAINPGLSYAYYNRGHIKRLALGDIQGAISDYSQAIEIEPQWADAYYNRGIDKSDLGDNHGAIADYNQAIEIKPQFALAYYNRGIVKGNLGDNQGEISDYSHAIEIDPQFVSAYVNRGITSEEAGDLSSACKDWRAAASLGEDAAAAWVRKQCN